MARTPVAGLLLAVLAAAPAAAPDKVTAASARDFVGKRATVCGKVVQIQKAFSGSGRSFLLHLDTIDPRPAFTIILSGSQIDSPFWNVAKTFPDKDVCATGYVRDRNGTPYVQIAQPSDIRIVKPD